MMQCVDLQSLDPQHSSVFLSFQTFLGNEGALYANLFNVAYRVFLYSYGYILFSGLKFEKKNLKQIILNPIIIATFLGFLIWMFQASLPQVTVGAGETAKTVAFLRLDVTLPWFMKVCWLLSIIIITTCMVSNRYDISKNFT
ncbi:hypothetical protein MX850_08850 [Erysipelothrix sp. Poltava]|nr:hypothetical protein MX850_08850 [Erysipelothrix sp. Poltava]